MKKRFFALLLCVLMVLALLPATAFAVSTITFTTQPEGNTVVTVGIITGSLTAQANVSDSGTATLNWYACNDSGAIIGDSLGTGESFTIPTDLNVGVYFYRCQATCEGAEPVNSRVAAVLVAPDVTFTTQPAENTTVTAGSITGNLTVETSVNPADTTGVTLNWYRTDWDGSFIYGESLGTGKTFAIPNMLAPGTYYYLCQATIETSLTVNSSVAEVTVEEVTDATSTISFTTHPYNGTTYVTEGIISEVLTASASVSPSGTPTLNWYQCTGLSGVVAGAPSLGTGETFAIPTDLQNVGTDYYYVCQATYPGAAPVNSKVATVRVSAASASDPAVGFTTHPAPSTTVIEGRISGSLTVEAKVVPSSSGLTPGLKWYECGADGFVSGPLLSTRALLEIPTNLSRGTYYYCCVAQCNEASPAVTTSRVAKVIVLASDAETVSKPTFSISSGTYASAQSVTLSCDTQGATIRYTTNGTEPTQSSPAYSTAISVSSTTTIKAKAFKDDMIASQTAIATYTITDNATSVWIAGQELTSTSPYYHNGENGAPGYADSNETDYNAYFNAAAGTLTLNGLSVVDSTVTKEMLFGTAIVSPAYAIFAKGNLTICVDGDNSVSVGSFSKIDDNAFSLAIYVTGELTVQPGDTGEGSLTAESKGATSAGSYSNFRGTSICSGVTSRTLKVKSGVTLTGTVSGTAAASVTNSIGVNADSIIVTGGTLKGTVSGEVMCGDGDADYATSWGIIVNNGNLSLSAGSVEATGGNALSEAGQSTGVAMTNADDSINITGGSFTAKAGTATTTVAVQNPLTLGSGVTAKGSTSSDGSGSESYVIADNANYKWVSVVPTPTVASVAVNPASVSIQKGGTQTFNAIVFGANDPAQTVTWAVTGGVSGTSIDEDGVLTVAANETAAMLTVKATSTVDTKKFGVANVTVTTPAPVEYQITRGANGEWTKGGSAGLGFTADGNYADFTGVSVDGTAISSDKYTSASGSTVVTLKASYLETLSAGRHALRVSFTDGYTETHFTIAATPIPATGDDSHTLLWLGIALLAGAGLTASLVLGRRKRKNG